MKQLFATVLVGLSLAACGGGGDLAAQADKEAAAACQCTTFECTKPHIGALNKMSIKQGDEVKKLAPDRAKAYHDAQMRAADCQDKLRPKP